MADNTVLNAAAGGDTVRDLARQGGSIKTQVVQLDLGGATANAEVLITAGQQVMAASVPVVLASNQPAIATTQPVASNNWGQSLALTAGATGTLASIASSVAGYQIKGLRGAWYWRWLLDGSSGICDGPVWPNPCNPADLANHFAQRHQRSNRLAGDAQSNERIRLDSRLRSHPVRNLNARRYPELLP